MAERGWVLGLDQGTGSSRAILVNARGKVAGVAAARVPRTVHGDGRIDQDAVRCWRSLRKAVRDLFASTSVKPDEVVGIGIACQRSTTVAYDRRTLEPLAPAISWQCLRTRDWMKRVRESTRRDLQRRTGLPPVPHYAASKIAWLQQELPARTLRRTGDALVIGTLDSFLAAHLARDHRPVTDLTHATRTLLVELDRQDWSPRSLKSFGIAREILPDVVPTIGQFGVLAPKALPPLRQPVPLLALAGDQQAALFGSGCRRPGQAKITYGSGAFLLAAAGSKVPKPVPDLIRSVAWSQGRKVEYLLETNVPSSGTVIDWLSRLVDVPFEELLHQDTRRADLATRLEAVTFLPTFAGLGPLRPDLPPGGLIAGLTHDVDAPRLASALATGIAAALAEGVDSAERYLGRRWKQLAVDGGGARDPRFLAIQSAVLQRVLQPLREQEATAFGAAALAWQAFSDRAPALTANGPAVRPGLRKAVARKVRERWLGTLAAHAATP